MENYKKSVIRELDTNLPLPEFLKSGNGSDSVTISVKTGTKMRNVLSFGFKQLERPEIRHVVWIGEAEAIGKTVSCAEIMKRGQAPGDEEQAPPPAKSAAKRKSVSANSSLVEAPKTAHKSNVALSQINVLGYRRTEEIWDPVVQGLDKLKVNKDVPILAVILSKDTPQNKDIPPSGVPVTAIQQQQPTTNPDFELFWHTRTNTTLTGASITSSAPLDIKSNLSRQAPTVNLSGRTPPF